MWREGRSEKEREGGGGGERDTHTDTQTEIETDKQASRIGKIMKLILRMDKVLVGEVRMLDRMMVQK